LDINSNLDTYLDSDRKSQTPLLATTPKKKSLRTTSFQQQSSTSTPTSLPSNHFPSPVPNWEKFEQLHIKDHHNGDINKDNNTQPSPVRHSLVTEFLRKGPLKPLNHRFWDSKSDTVKVPFNYVLDVADSDLEGEDDERTERVQSAGISDGYHHDSNDCNMHIYASGDEDKCEKVIGEGNILIYMSIYLCIY
jgi:hypothetical protein